MTRRAFTIIELLVVILIITILALVAIPSFSAMVYSSEAALAETRLTTAFRAARDAAVRSSGDEDAALAFFYEPGGRLTIVPCLKVGRVEDHRVTGGGIPDASRPVVRDVFVPVDFMEPVQMPRNWMIRGYAPFGSIDSASGDWYEEANGQQRYGDRLLGGPDAGRGDWVFPETAFYLGGTPQTAGAAAANTSGAYRQSFMVRFQAGSGMLAPTGIEALVISPRPSGLGRVNPPHGGWRIDRAVDLRRFVRQVLQDPMIDPITGAPAANPADWRRWLLGDYSSDTVLCKSVGQVALYDENRLAAGLASVGVRLDRNSGCIYAFDPANPYPQLPAATVPPAELSHRINRWIEGDTNFDGEVHRSPPGGPRGVDEPSARVFTIDRHTGEARRVEVEP